MLNPRWVVFPAVLLLSTVAFAAPQQNTAHAEIMNSKGEKIGNAVFTQTDQGVSIALNVSGLTPGTHAIHVHSVGKCDPPDFKTAGGHLNPFDKHHGKDNPEGPHAGDMLNIEVGADGAVHTTVLAPGATLGDGANSVFHEGGTALVIHEKADDYKTDPAGNSGARVACGVIEKSI
ncbi:MAG TPA: superoxide dismutase family protein [Candidatus Acidoferrum sp.]|nr:superoxide dismutase family protein [Candidatus Acidoferrum sp.]